MKGSLVTLVVCVAILGLTRCSQQEQGFYLRNPFDKSGSVSFFYSVERTYDGYYRAFVSLDTMSFFFAYHVDSAYGFRGDPSIQYKYLQLADTTKHTDAFQFKGISHVTVAFQFKGISPGTHALRIELIRDDSSAVNYWRSYTADVVEIDDVAVESGRNTSLGVIESPSEESALDSVRVENLLQLSQLERVGLDRCFTQQDVFQIMHCASMYASAPIFPLVAGRGPVVSSQTYPPYRRNCVTNPFKTSVFTKANKTFEVLYFYTHRRHRDNLITDDELTPVLLVNGKLAGWGWECYEEIIGK
jgi:hypothetical protein